MEEGGHYYTVYYTSLAVGFDKQTAYRHAVLSQMPDEVGWMDAYTMHTNEMLALIKRANKPLLRDPSMFPYSLMTDAAINQAGYKVKDFNGVEREVPSDVRFDTEYGVHSLPDLESNETTRSSRYQQNFTYKELMKESPVSLRFGLLLHRLGDTYAHSRIGKTETMYTVSKGKCFAGDNVRDSFGHGLRDGHEADYPFLRITDNVFFSYLKKLHEVLSAKVSEMLGGVCYDTISAPRNYDQVKGDFNFIFTYIENRAKKQFLGPLDKTKAKWFIEEIQRSAETILKTKMNAYYPEIEEGLTLSEFLSSHPELNNLKIDGQKLTNTIKSMIPSEAR